MRTTAVLVAAVSLSLPLLGTPAVAVPGSAGTAVRGGELVLPAGARAVPRATQILNAGTTGFLWAQEGDFRLLWTDYATGTATALSEELPGLVEYNPDEGFFRNAAHDEPGWYGDGSDTVALHSSPSHVTLLKGSGADGTSTVVPLPEAHSYRGTFGDTVITRSDRYDRPTAYHLWRAGTGSVTETPVTGLPERAYGVVIEDGDARSVVLRYRVDSSEEPEPSWHWSILDLATGAATPLPDRVPQGGNREVTGFRLGEGSVLRLRSERGEVDVFDRGDLAAPHRTLDTGGLGGEAAYGIVGSALLGVDPVREGGGEYRGRPLLALVSNGGRTARSTVMEPAGQQIVQAPDGSVLVAGAERYIERGDLDWGVHRITQTDDKSIVRSRLTTVQPVPAQIHGLSLGSGVLTVADNSTMYETGRVLGAYRSRWLGTPAAGGAPSVTKTTVDGPLSEWDGYCHRSAPRCVRMLDDGAGRHGRREDTESGLTMLRVNGVTGWGPALDTRAGTTQLAGLSGRYAIIDIPYSRRQFIAEFPAEGPAKVLHRRDRVASAVWGSTLWSGAAKGGKVTATRLPGTGAVESFTTRNGCTPSDLQAVGRWVYWDCGSPQGGSLGSGVYDRATKRTVTAPAGRSVLLGDGYLAHRIAEAQGDVELSLIDLHGGLPSSGLYTDLPSRELADWTDSDFENTDAGTSWTVDRFGGGVAYADDEQRIRIVPTGVPASALSAIDSTVTAGAASWSGAWWLSKPAAEWKVTVRHKASGATVRTLSGSAARGVLKAAWNGKDSAGRPVVNGQYTWTLSARPADGKGAALALSGTVGVTAGTAAPRDHAGDDGVGDVLTLDSSGTLAVHRGTGKGTLGGKVSGSGWPAGSLVVPFGDLGDGRCNDVLVRTKAGALRAHHPACGKAATPKTPYTSLGTSGWNQYDILTSPGDVNGDRRPDLVGRHSPTGDVYLFKGTSAGKLSARTKIASRWTGHKKIVGAGDLNGDGRGDLLVQDKSDKLWRHEADGTSTGGLKPRVKVFDGWGTSYNATVGVGDFTGDGRADLVSRDTSGNVWRENGNGKGSFGKRVKIASGWKSYKSVS
ncbi:FG-GAP-like repeat-containing protein [Streptomyces inusitatus]|uniref:FG-GAP-like repeat-containing protein n=1 Tax=Streptomyces inusitatus TaxID=68221 RepID=UPI001E546B8F|nr:FG-GAP-like repeat-containing protein [Streptomyces inusitatus]